MIKQFTMMLAVVPIVAGVAHGDDMLQRQVDELRERIAMLAADQERNWLDEQRAEETRAMVNDLLLDANRRASLQAGGVTGGHDGSFFIADDQSNFRLNISGLAQVRYVYNHQRRGGLDGDRHRSGFENRRTQLILAGSVLDPSWQYRVHGDFGRDGSFSALDLYIEKRFENDWTLRAGQFRPRLLLEDITSSGRQLAAERSLVNAAFRQGWTQGVQLAGPLSDELRMTIAYVDGIPSRTGATGSGMSTPWNVPGSEYTIIGSLEWLIAGQWGQLRDFTSWADDPFGMVLGGAVAWQRDAHGTSNEVAELLRWTVDGSVNLGGANVFAAFVGNHENTRGGERVDQFGLVVQSGVHVVPDQWELFTRYEWGHTDGIGRDLSVLTVGVNRYLARNNLKLTTDVAYAFNELAPFWATPSAGWRADANGEQGQIVVRSQVQFFF